MKYSKTEDNYKFNKNELIASDDINTLKNSKAFIKILINKKGCNIKDLSNNNIYVVENKDDFLKLLFFLQENKMLFNFS